MPRVVDTDNERQLRAVMARCCRDIAPHAWRFSPVTGLSGTNWRATISDDVTFLLRPQNAEKQLLGISRRRELRILRRLTGQALAPVPRGYIDGWLVCEWLTGTVPARLPQNDVLAALLARVHGNGLSQPRVSLRHQYAAYWQALDRRRLTPAMLRRQRLWLGRPEPKPLRLALLHMDVHPANLVADEAGWRLIDWEYAGAGDVALELAALYRGNDWPDERQRAFCIHYAAVARLNDAMLWRQITRWLPRVDYLMWLWYEVRWQQSGERRFCDMADALARRLN